MLAWEAGAFELIVSKRLLDELQDVLLRPKFERPGRQATLDAFLRRLSAATISADPPSRRIVPDDEKNDYIMLVGEAADAHHVVSGDPHLTTMRDPRPPVLTPEPSTSCWLSED